MMDTTISIPLDSFEAMQRYMMSECVQDIESTEKIHLLKTLCAGKTNNFNRMCYF